MHPYINVRRFRKDSPILPQVLHSNAGTTAILNYTMAATFYVPLCSPFTSNFTYCIQRLAEQCKY
jgi:hypothetical protein